MIKYAPNNVIQKNKKEEKRGKGVPKFFYSLLILQMLFINKIIK